MFLLVLPLEGLRAKFGMKILGVDEVVLPLSVEEDVAGVWFSTVTALFGSERHITVTTRVIIMAPKQQISHPELTCTLLMFPDSSILLKQYAL